MISLDFSNSKYFNLVVPSEKDAQSFNLNDKGWSYSYVYSMRELKDVYLLLKTIKDKSLINITEKCIDIIIPEKREWTSRKVLEQLNALKNFKLIDNYYNVMSDAFLESKIGAPLTLKDKIVFKQIYFGYFRFNILQLWFIDPNINDFKNLHKYVNETSLRSKSKSLFYFSSKSRFIDTFFYSLNNNTDIYYLKTDDNNNNDDIMRFWDVFIKWGLELSLIEKYNLKDLDINMLNNEKSVRLIYFINDNLINFNLFDYVRNCFNDNYISISKLVLSIAIKYRYRICDIIDFILTEIGNNKSKYEFQRTSEIFIKNEEKKFLPKINDYFVSHLLIK